MIRVCGVRAGGTVILRECEGCLNPPPRRACVSGFGPHSCLAGAGRLGVWAVHGGFMRYVQRMS